MIDDKSRKGQPAFVDEIPSCLPMHDARKTAGLPILTHMLIGLGPGCRSSCTNCDLLDVNRNQPWQPWQPGELGAVEGLASLGSSGQALQTRFALIKKSAVSIQGRTVHLFSPRDGTFVHAC